MSVAPPSERLAALSVDLDPLEHYARLFSLDAALDDRARTLIATTAIPRFLELFDEVGAPATFFVIGQDVAEPRLAEALKTAYVSGVELASHSHAHDYGLSRLSPSAIADDLAKAHAAITELTGVAPTGFRAPGYTLSPELLRAVVAQGYAWDSSAFPAAPYYLLKASVMGALRALGRPSGATLDSPRVLLAPRVPYRPSAEAPYQKGLAALVELPISVTPSLRVPFIGQLLMLAPWAVVTRAADSLADDALVNLELHAVDVLDVTDGIPKALAARQRDLQVPVKTKLDRLRAVFRRLADARELVTVGEAARRLGPLVEGRLRA